MQHRLLSVLAAAAALLGSCAPKAVPVFVPKPSVAPKESARVDLVPVIAQGGRLSAGAEAVSRRAGDAQASVAAADRGAKEALALAGQNMELRAKLQQVLEDLATAQSGYRGLVSEIDAHRQEISRLTLSLAQLKDAAADSENEKAILRALHADDAAKITDLGNAHQALAAVASRDAADAARWKTVRSLFWWGVGLLVAVVVLALILRSIRKAANPVS